MTNTTSEHDEPQTDNIADVTASGSVQDLIFEKFCLYFKSLDGHEEVASRLRETFITKKVFNESAIRRALFGDSST